MLYTDASPDIDEPTGGEYRDFEKNVLLEQDTSLSQVSQLTDDDASEKPQSVSKRKKGRPRKRGIEKYCCMIKCNLDINMYVISSFNLHL